MTAQDIRKIADAMADLIAPVQPRKEDAARVQAVFEFLDRLAKEGVTT